MYELLLGNEANPGDEDSVRDLNATRKLVLGAFASIRVWLLPTPNTNTEVLLKKLTFEDMSTKFTDKVAELRAVTAGQLQEARSFGGSPLTFGLLPDLLEASAGAMNEGAGDLCPVSLMRGVHKK